MRQIRKIKVRIDAEGEHIHSHRDDVDIACTLSIAEERTLDAVRAGEQPQLRIRYATAAVVVRV